jgi:hypothetical protein
MQRIEATSQRISTELPTTSATTIAPKARPARTGTPHGEPGLPTKNALLPKVMAGASPDQTDRELEASLTRLLGSKPKPVEKVTYPGEGFTVEIQDFRLPAASLETQERARQMVAKSLTPMTPSECLGLLGEMKLSTICRPEQGHDLEAQLALYARKLQEYPADVVRKVLTTQPNQSKWWPAWAELKERLDVFSERRRKLQRAMMTWKSPPSSTAAPSARYRAPERPAKPREPEMTQDQAEADLAANQAKWVNAFVDGAA